MGLSPLPLALSLAPSPSVRGGAHRPLATSPRPIPCTLSLRKRRCPIALVPSLPVPGLSSTLYSPFLSLGRGCQAWGGGVWREQIRDRHPSPAGATGVLPAATTCTSTGTPTPAAPSRTTSAFTATATTTAMSNNNYIHNYNHNRYCGGESGRFGWGGGRGCHNTKKKKKTRSVQYALRWRPVGN